MCQGWRQNNKGRKEYLGDTGAGFTKRTWACDEQTNMILGLV